MKHSDQDPSKASSATRLPTDQRVTVTHRLTDSGKRPVAQTDPRLDRNARWKRYEESRPRAWPALRVHCLLARAAVEALTQQVDVADVADVADILLDRVDDDVARLDLLAVDDRRVQVQVGVDGPGMRNLTTPGVPRSGDDLVVGNGLVEVQVRVFLGAVEAWQLELSLEDSARPGVLDPIEVTDHTQQRHRGRRD